MTSGDYIPSGDTERDNWMNNLKTQIAVQGPILGLTAATITAIQTACTNGSTKIQKAVEAMAVAKGLIEAKEAMNEPGGEIFSIRKYAANIKTLPNYTEAIGETLRIVGGKTGSKMPDAEYQPKLTARVQGDVITLRMVKNGARGGNFYVRTKGTADWTAIGYRDSFPFDYKPDSLKPGQALHLEFTCYGVKKNKEFGKPANIVQVVYGVVA